MRRDSCGQDVGPTFLVSLPSLSRGCRGKGWVGDQLVWSVGRDDRHAGAQPGLESLSSKCCSLSLPASLQPVNKQCRAYGTRPERSSRCSAPPVLGHSAPWSSGCKACVSPAPGGGRVLTALQGGPCSLVGAPEISPSDHFLSSTF